METLKNEMYLSIFLTKKFLKNAMLAFLDANIMFSIKVFSDESSSDTTERYDDVKESAVTQEDITQNNINEEESSSEDENTVSCAICLSKLKPQNLPSKPDSGCGHMFCRECLVEWSKQVLKELFGPCKSEKIR